MFGKFFSWVVSKVSLTLLMALSLQNSAEATEVEASHAEEPRDASDAQKLKASYAAFLDAVERRDEQIAFEQSMETLRLAEILYQPDSPSLAALTMNAALAQPVSVYGLPYPSALPLMRKLVERYETLHGVDSPLIAEALTLLIETLFSEQRSIKLDDAKNARKQFLRIGKEIARSTERVSQLAKQHPAKQDWTVILSRISRLSVPDSRELADQLLSTQIATLGEDHEDVQQTRYLIATNFLKGRKKLKELRLLASHPGLSPPTRFATLQLLVRDGPKRNRSEYLAKLEEFTVEGSSLYANSELRAHSLPPSNYPAKARDMGVVGWVIVEFDVSSKGFVESPEVVSSCAFRSELAEAGKCELSYSRVFNKAALESIANGLYIPPFVDGKPTAQYGMQNKLTFGFN